MKKFNKPKKQGGGQKKNFYKGFRSEKKSDETKKRKQQRLDDDDIMNEIDDSAIELSNRMTSLQDGKKPKKNKKIKKAPEIITVGADDEQYSDKEEKDDKRTKSVEEQYLRRNLQANIKLMKELEEEEERAKTYKKVKLRLPVKTEDGKIKSQIQEYKEEEKKKQQPKKDKKKEEVVEEEEEEEEELNEEGNLFTPLGEENDITPSEKKSDDQIEKESKLKLTNILQNKELLEKRRNQIKIEIGSIASTILENPEISFGRIFKIYEYVLDGDIWVKKIAILSMCAIFRDVIPDYKINLDVVQNNVRFSKEVKARRSFESNILKHYQRYILYIVKHAKSSTSKIQLICAKALSELLAYKPHFNFTYDIIRVVVPLLNASNEQVRKQVYENIAQLFSDDSTKGYTTLDVVEEIGNFIKKKKYEITTEIIDVFLSLKLKHVLKDKALPDKIINRRKVQKKKKAKNLSEQEELTREMKETQISASEIKKIQTDILRAIIVCYVRLLKQKPDSPIVFCALAGLAKYSHLMNIDLLYSLLDYMKALLEVTEDVKDLIQGEGGEDQDIELPIRTVLQTLITTARLLSGLGEAIDIDPKEFYTQLYIAIDRVISEGYDDTLFRLLIDALVLLLLKPSKLPLIRVCAFIKKLSCLSFCTPVHMSIAFLEIVRELIIKYPNSKQMFSNEESGIGAYNWEDTIPDNTTPFASPLYEISHASRFYHPQVNEILEGIKDACGLQSRYQQSKALKTLKQLTVGDYQQILTDFDPLSGKFKPPVQTPKENPLQLKYEKWLRKMKEANSKKRRELRDKIVFVVPSITHMRSPFALECLKKSSSL
ncbi:hypothetical protein ABK040_002878 [Willaertia magna]